jgi:DNA-binding beta-propeller fold protein YncE
VAPLAWPYSTATDGRTVYVGDTFHHVIQVIDLATGKTTMLAGANGVLGSDDGVGERARFYWPKGIVVGPDLFVADSGNHTIRRIVLETGEVTTLAGSAGLGGPEDGIGSAARFASPKALAIDGSDVLYVADTFNNAVRRITISTAEVSTVVDSTAGLSNPQGLAVDRRNIYVADTDHHVIRRIDKLTGTVSLLAGREQISGASDGEGLVATFSTPQGLAIDRTNLYVCDSGNHTIRSIDLADDRFPVMTIAGSAGMPGSADGIGAQVRFNAPVGLSTDGVSLFIADTFNSTIRQLGLAGGQVTTLAGRAPS